MVRVPVALSAQNDSNFWVEGPAGVASHSFYLCKGHHGTLHILDADGCPAQPVRLGLRTYFKYHAFMGSGGLLRIVEARIWGKCSTGNLVWHTIDPTSGETIDSQFLHEWKRGLCLSGCLYHAVVHRVMGMTNEGSVAIMNADTLAEICRFDPTLDKGDPGEPVLTLRELAWSPKGNMIAVQVLSILDFRDILGGTSEVHIYDTASGQCIQSALVQARCMQMAWSKSLDKLAICCESEDTSLLEEEEGSATTIRIMDPALQTEALLPAQLAIEFGSGWERCAWTPCGRLLIAQFEIDLTSEEDPVHSDPDSPSGGLDSGSLHFEAHLFDV